MRLFRKMRLAGRVRLIIIVYHFFFVVFKVSRMPEMNINRDFLDQSRL